MAIIDVSNDLRLTQLGLETTAGTAVTTNRRLQAISLDFQQEMQVDTWGPMGYLFDTGAAPIQEWATAKVSGKPCYNALTYIFESLLKKVTATGGGTAKTRLYSIKPTASEIVQTYTIESGPPEHAQKMAYGTFNSFSLDVSRTGIKLDGALIAQKLTDGVYFDVQEVQTGTMTGTPTGGTVTLALTGYATTGTIAYNATASVVQTALDLAWGAGNTVVTGGPWPGTPVVVTFAGSLAATNMGLITVGTNALTGGSSPNVAFVETTPGASPTDVAVQPVLPTHFNMWMDDTWATLGTTQIDRGFGFKFNFQDRWAPVWALKTADPSWSALVVGKPKVEGSLTLGANSTGMGLLTNQRAGSTKFIRVQAVGDPISGGGNYTLQFDLAVKFSGPFKFSAEGKTLGAEWPFTVVLDATATKAVDITLINALASL